MVKGFCSTSEHVFVLKSMDFLVQNCPCLRGFLRSLVFPGRSFLLRGMSPQYLEVLWQHHTRSDNDLTLKICFINQNTLLRIPLSCKLLLAKCFQFNCVLKKHWQYMVLWMGGTWAQPYLVLKHFEYPATLNSLFHLSISLISWFHQRCMLCQGP